MQRKNRKLLLDIVMAISFVLLMNLSFTGLAVHEILGLGILVFFTLHKWLNLSWIKGVGLGMVCGRIRGGAVLKFVLDGVLLLLTVLIVISGVMMSRVLFPGLAAGNRSLWYTLHVISAAVCSGLLVLHTGLHWRFIVNGIRMAAQNRSVRRWGAGALAAFAIAGAVRGVFLWGSLSEDASLSASGSENLNPGNSTDLTNGNEKNVTDGNSGEDETDDGGCQTIVPASPAETVSLDEYLGRLVCTGCGRHCSLLSPRCAKGELQAAQAEQAYYEEYADE